MAVTLDAALGTGNNAGATTCAITTTNAVAATGRPVIIVGYFFNGVRTCTMSGMGLTWAEDAVLRAASLHISIFSAPDAAGHASGQTITATFSAAVDSVMGGGSFLGIDTSGTVIASATNNGSTAAWNSGTVASTSGNALIGGAFIDNGATTSSLETSPGIELFDKNVGAQSETTTGVYKLSVAGSDSVAGTWNAAAAWIAAGVCYKAAAGGAAVEEMRLTTIGAGA